MTVPLPQSFEMLFDLGTVTVCRMDAAIDYAATVSAADNAALREALTHISLCSKNSMSSKDECGSIARAALREAT
jgi:hypothetical protein